MSMEDHVNDMSNEIHCDVRVVTESLSEQRKVWGRSKNVVARLPVVISKNKIHINISARLKFDKYMLDIVNCRRDVQLSGCKLMDTGNGRYGKLFLEGYINERIEYIDAGCNNGCEFSGVLRFLSIKIPFECVSRIDYFQIPLLRQNKSFNYIKVKHNKYRDNDSEAFNSMFHGDTSSPYEMYCEVEDSEIVATTAMGSHPIDSGIFDEVDECLVLSLTVILLQEQLVNVY